MKFAKLVCSLLLLLFILQTVTAAAYGKTPPSELLGAWNYTSMTTLLKGKPFGTVHFPPGEWTVTFNQDATWTMNPSRINPSQMTGTYEVHGQNLEMKLSNGNPYNRYRFKVEDGGKVLVLTDDKSSFRAIHE